MADGKWRMADWVCQHIVLDLIYRRLSLPVFLLCFTFTFPFTFPFYLVSFGKNPYRFARTTFPRAANMFSLMFIISSYCILVSSWSSCLVCLNRGSKEKEERVARTAGQLGGDEFCILAENATESRTF
jgi:hypothetical protein